MNHPKSESYIQTKSIKLGEYQLPPFWQHLVDWVGTTFGVTALNVELSCNEEIDRQDIDIILERISDCKKLEAQLGDQVATYMAPFLYSKERPTDDETKTRILVWRTGRPLNIHVDCYSFENVYHMEISQQLSSIAGGSIKRKYPKLIEQITANANTQYVFYKKEADVVEGRANGVSADITQMYFEALKSRDKFAYFTIDDLSIIFDSKENLDKNFGGNDYYYFK